MVIQKLETKKIPRETAEILQGNLHERKYLGSSLLYNGKYHTAYPCNIALTEQDCVYQHYFLGLQRTFEIDLAVAIQPAILVIGIAWLVLELNSGCRFVWQFAKAIGYV